MKTIKNANLATLANIITKRNRWSAAQEIAHATNIRMSNVDVIEYDADELVDYKPKNNTFFFFVSKYNQLIKITRDKKVIRNYGADRGWNKTVAESSKVYEVKDTDLASVYVNGRKNNYITFSRRKKNSLSDRLQAYKENKLLRLSSFDEVMAKVRRAYTEIGLNIVNQSDEFLAKIPYENVYSFAQMLPQYVHDVTRYMDENEEYHTYKEYKEKLYSLYKYVKNF
jgi:hypothetical protein